MRKVIIKNDTGLVRSTRIVDEDTGQDLTKCVSEAHVHFVPNELVQADLSLALVRADTFAYGAFTMYHPSTGRKMEVKSVTFADGSVLEL